MLLNSLFKISLTLASAVASAVWFNEERFLTPLCKWRIDKSHDIIVSSFLVPMPVSWKWEAIIFTHSSFLLKSQSSAVWLHEERFLLFLHILCFWSQKPFNSMIDLMTLLLRLCSFGFCESAAVDDTYNLLWTTFDFATEHFKYFAVASHGFW